MGTRNENRVLAVLLGNLEKPEKCDVKFNVRLGGAWMPFYGNKLILSIWSPVFATRFSKNENDESFTEIDIDGYPPTVFKCFLKFMYGCTEGISENKCNGKFLLDLYKLAEAYQVEQLKKDCRKILIAATVEFENVFQFLNAADYITDLKIVRLRCFELIRNKTTEVLAAQDLKKITSPMVFTVLNLDTLSLSSECDLLSWVFNWVRSECEKFPETEPQKIIQPFLPYLNFASLKAEQFAVLVNKHKEFLDNTDGFRIFLNICDPGPSCMALPSWHNEAKNFRSYKSPNCEDLNTMPSENLLSNDTLKDTSPVELSSNADITTNEPFEDLKELKEDTTKELLNQSVKDSSSKSDPSANNSDAAVYKSALKNAKPQEYHMDDVMDSLNSFEQIAISLSEASLLNQANTHEFENESNHYYSLNDYNTDNSQVEIDCSKLRKKIKKKKVKKWYLRADGRSKPHTASMDSVDGIYSSGDFENLIGMVWKQHRLSNA